MNPFFAKYLFTFAALLQPGQDMPFVGYGDFRQGADIQARAFWDPEIWVGDNGQGTPVQRQIYCVTAGGIYQVGFQLAMQPMPAGTAEVGGWVELRTPTEAIILTRWRAAQGEWTMQGGVATVPLAAGGCVHLRYSSSGSAYVNPDSRVTYFSIARLGG